MSDFYTPDQWIAIIRPIAPEAFLTGSRAFGTATDPVPYAPPDWANISKSPDISVPIHVSDTDIAVLIENKIQLRTSLDARFPCTHKDSEYNAGYKFETLHGVLNIVPLHPLDFVAWKLTTAHIKRIVALCPDARDRIRNRETKLGIFEALSGIHKMLIPYKGNDEMAALAEEVEA